MLRTRSRKSTKNKLYDEKAPAAVRNLEEKGYDVVRLTVGEIELILFTNINITLEGSKLRMTDYVGALEKEMRMSISKLPVAVKK
jgi:hypothetical protein